MARRDFFQATPVGYLIEADCQLEIAETYRQDERRRQAEAKDHATQKALMANDPRARLLLQTLPRFRDVIATPGTHYAVRAEGHIVQLVVGPKGGIRFRHATVAEITQLLNR
jgi:hypothetical protein